MLVTPADFSPFCITAPSDSRLPGGGGYQVCGLYDVTPAKFGQVNSVITQAENFGKLSRVNDFFNVTSTARLKADLLVGGGVDTGRSVNDACFDVDSPGAVATAPSRQPRRHRRRRALHADAVHEARPSMARTSAASSRRSRGRRS